MDYTFSGRDSKGMYLWDGIAEDFTFLEDRNISRHKKRWMLNYLRLRRWFASITGKVLTDPYTFFEEVKKSVQELKEVVPRDQEVLC